MFQSELEGELAVKLDVASPVGEAPDLCGVVIADTGVRAGEAGMVQCVFRIGTNFKSRLFQDIEGLSERKVYVGVAGPGHRVAMDVTEYPLSACGHTLAVGCTAAGESECRLVEPVVDAPLRFWNPRIPNQVGILSTGLGIREIRRHRGSKWGAGVLARSCRQSPSTDDFIHNR